MIALIDEDPTFFDLPPAPAAVVTEKARIDAMTYEQMLRLVRGGLPLGDPLFRGEIGRHFHATIKVKRHATPPDERWEISKRVGF